MVKTDLWLIESEGDFHIIPLTDRLKDAVDESGLVNGVAMLYYQHTTGAILVMEQEEGIFADLQDCLERASPRSLPYFHHFRGVDHNGHAHIWSMLLSGSAGVVIPFVEGKLQLGGMQEVVLIDMQTEEAPRKVTVMLLGE